MSLLTNSGLILDSCLFLTCTYDIPLSRTAKRLLRHVLMYFNIPLRLGSEISMVDNVVKLETMMCRFTFI